MRCDIKYELWCKSTYVKVSVQMDKEKKSNQRKTEKIKLFSSFY